MKKVQLFENYLNEAISFNADVQEPFEIKDEKKAQKQFKIIAEPITMVSVDGDIDEGMADVTIFFSNRDSISRVWEQTPVKANTNSIVISPRDSSDIDVTLHTDKYVGSTGTVVGDLGLIYRDWKLGKIN